MQDDEEPSFFELLGRDPDTDDGVVLAPRRKSLDEVDGEYVDVAESDFVRLEALEGKPTKKQLLLPKLALAPAVAAPAPAPPAAAPAAAGVSFEEAPDGGAELSLAELLQEDFERQRAETARAAEATKEEAPLRVSLTARLRGRSASISASHASEVAHPAAAASGGAVAAPSPAKTRGALPHHQRGGVGHSAAPFARARARDSASARAARIGCGGGRRRRRGRRRGRRAHGVWRLFGTGTGATSDARSQIILQEDHNCDAGAQCVYWRRRASQVATERRQAFVDRRRVAFVCDSKVRVQHDAEAD